MESEKVKEIKETLKRCGSGKDGCCWGCSLQDTQNIAKCTTVLCDKALTLINELESENERLSDTEIGELIKENDDLEKQCMKWSELDFKRRNKIKELKDRIAELEKRCHFIWALGYDYDGCEKAESLKSLIDELVGIAQGNWGDVCSKCENKQDNLINDKLKQFAEMLKEKGKSNYDFFQCPTKENKVISISDIDETLKEFI